MGSPLGRTDWLINRADLTIGSYLIMWLSVESLSLMIPSTDILEHPFSCIRYTHGTPSMPRSVRNACQLDLYQRQSSSYSIWDGLNRQFYHYALLLFIIGGRAPLPWQELPKFHVFAITMALVFDVQFISLSKIKIHEQNRLTWPR